MRFSKVCAALCVPPQGHAEDEPVPTSEAGGGESARRGRHRAERRRLPAAGGRARGSAEAGEGGASGSGGHDDPAGHGTAGAEGRSVRT